MSWRWPRRWRWPWPWRGRGSGVLAVAVVAITLLGIAVAWSKAAPGTAPRVFTPFAAPTVSRPAPWSAERLWPSHEAGTLPTQSGSSRFVAVSGVGCRSTAEVGHFAAYPAGSVPNTRRGGWGASGCSGVFWTVPMSGTTEDDPSTYVLWWFAPRGMDRGSCDVAMYVPMADRPDDASGHPTAYLVLRGREQPVVVGSFLVDQTVNRGRWVAVGRYTLADGEIVIKMLNRGSGGNRHAAAQAWIECTRQ